MKPVGLSNPHAPHVRPHAVVQLRQDNALGTLWNMVGFQTRLKHGEQKRVLRMIPGLANAEFARLGGLHRNTFLNSPKLLDGELRLRREPRLRFAGQITGCEGYVESAGIGLLAGRAAAAARIGKRWVPPPATTALGALLSHITGGHLSGRDAALAFQPMNVNFGLFPPLAAPESGDPRGSFARGAAKKRALAERALADLEGWLDGAPAQA
jgi:methylenetetrahydrofolate--tRNA-(uracil-5-)-methyltransferase